MLPSPPLSADSGSSLPRSLKRTFAYANDDPSPPPSQPLKRRRCSTKRESHEDIWRIPSGLFDPNNLITPPEYPFVPYDPEFGAKVCRRYKMSLRITRACDAIAASARRRKYGEENALAYSAGSTPDHIRASYEEEERRLDKEFEDIIANSDSEFEVEPEAIVSKRGAVK